MSCAACVNKVEKALAGLNGVASARVNLAAAKAGVEYDPAACSLADMEQAIAGVGYEVPWDRIELLVLGMMGTHCQQNIERAVGALDGVARVQVNLGTDTVTVDYTASLISAAQVRKAIRDMGYEVSDKAEGEASWTANARRASTRSAASSATCSSPRRGRPAGDDRHVPRLLGAGHLRPQFLSNKCVLWACWRRRSCFGPGRQFFVNSWRGLRHGVTDMNLLYATGIGAAYGIAVINTLSPEAGFGGEGATFFESAALLTAFIVLGR